MIGAKRNNRNFSAVWPAFESFVLLQFELFVGFVAVDVEAWGRRRGCVSFLFSLAGVS